MHVWLAMDPEDNRVTMQDREFSEADFPPGFRGQGWAIREADISEEDWAGIMAGSLSGEEVDAVHRTAWTENGDAPWPSL